jgi:hypothetical protein
MNLSAKKDCTHFKMCGLKFGMNFQMHIPWILLYNSCEMMNIFAHPISVINDSLA